MAKITTTFEDTKFRLHQAYRAAKAADRMSSAFFDSLLGRDLHHQLVRHSGRGLPSVSTNCLSQKQGRKLSADKRARLAREEKRRE